MKKRVVAILLSLTMCSSMVTEAGAAAMLDSAVESYSENSFSDSESDVTVEEEPMVDGETETPEDTDGGNIFQLKILRERCSSPLTNLLTIQTAMM